MKVWRFPDIFWEPSWNSSASADWNTEFPWPGPLHRKDVPTAARDSSCAGFGLSGWLRPCRVQISSWPFLPPEDPPVRASWHGWIDRQKPLFFTSLKAFVNILTFFGPDGKETDCSRGERPTARQETALTTTVSSFHHFYIFDFTFLFHIGTVSDIL